MRRCALARGRIAIVDRVDGAVAAMRINALLMQDHRWPRCVPDSEPWAIIAALKQPAVDRTIIRKWLDALLDAWLEPAHLTALLRARVCELENALGLHHDDRSVEAFLALGAGDTETWSAYVARLRAQGRPIEIPIPITTEADHAHARS